MECSIDACAKTATCRGWCPAHYQRWRHYGDPLAPSRAPVVPAVCSVEGCEAPGYARELCSRHYLRQKRYGDPLAGGPERSPAGECSVDGCGKRGTACHGYSARLCAAHAYRWRTNGDAQADKPLQGQWANDACNVGGCERPAATRGMCKMHYYRWWKTGDPGPSESRRILGDDEARFWSYVNQDRPVPASHPELGPCWPWNGPTTQPTPDGPLYGVTHVDGTPGRNVRAHRFAYELLVGEIPPKKHLHHRCENTLCVNPKHLEPLSPAAHLALTDPVGARDAAMAARTTCSRGHPKDRFGYHNGKQWVCRECARLRAAWALSEESRRHLLSPPSSS